MALSDTPKQEEDISVAKAHAFHDEEVIEVIDREQSTWQCLRQNPKIISWSLFANRKPPLFLCFTRKPLSYLVLYLNETRRLCL
jgi:hypothetical protein